jgi:hypothetical protein
MAYRSFRDANGTEWEAWEVIPRLAERRSGQRRQDADDGTDTSLMETPEEAERRGQNERRQFGQRRVVLGGLERGWLCFEHAGEKRRLAPIPVDWPRCDDETLARYCDLAKPTRRPDPRLAVLPSAPLPAKAEESTGTQLEA